MAGRELLRIISFAAAAVAIIVVAGSAVALDAPSDRPILTVSGNIANTNGDGNAVFDRKMLETLGMVRFQTMTPWYDQPVEFEGVPVRAVLEAVGASGDQVTAVALNDYKATIPTEDFTRFDVVLALKRDGQYMPVRDKGPLFIVYPYDSDPELQTQKYYSRSVWQVSQLVVE